MPSPFPTSSRVTLSMRAAGIEVGAQGVVRVMHPEKGMGVEFTQATLEHRAAVEKFLLTLHENSSVMPELTVQPDGLDTDAASAKSGSFAVEDPLLQLFYGAPLSPEEFHETLRKQRGAPSQESSMAAHA